MSPLVSVELKGSRGLYPLDGTVVVVDDEESSEVLVSSASLYHLVRQEGLAGDRIFSFTLVRDDGPDKGGVIYKKSRHDPKGESVEKYELPRGRKVVLSSGSRAWEKIVLGERQGSWWHSLWNYMRSLT